MNNIISILAACLALVAVAHADIVVIGNVTAATMTKDEVSDLFLGKTQARKPLDQSSSAPIKAQFYQTVTGHDLAQIRALWSRLIFTGRGLPPKELPDAAAVKKAVAADLKAVGYIRKSEVDSSVKVILLLN